MKRAFDQLHQQDNRTQWIWTAAIAAITMFALVALAWTPAATNWVSEAAQAEFAASTMTPDAAPVQIAADRVR